MSGWTWSAAEILLNATWIGALAYLAAWAICRLPAAGPRARAAACLAALAAAVALPSLQRVEWPQPAAEPVAVSIAVLPPTKVVPSAEPIPVSIVSAAPVSLQAGPVMESLVRVWLLGALCGLTYLAFGLAAALRLKWNARRPSGDWVPRVHRWTAGAARGARVLLSDEIRAPVAVGWLRPAVLFPPALGDTLHEAELERLWLHEAAHLERRDDWLVLLERLCLALLWFHPLAWALARRVAAEREMACDALAADRSGSRREYARTLTRLAELRIARGVAPALSIAGESSLSRRIEMLLNDSPRPGGRMGRSGLTFAATVCAAATAGVLTIGPLIGLAQNPPAAPPSPASPASPPSFPSPPPPAQVAAALAAPPAPAAPQAAPAPAPKPAPAPRPKPTPVAPVPPVPPNPGMDRETHVEMREFSEEIRQLAEEIREHVQKDLKPLHEEMRVVGEQMRLKSEPFAEKMRDLAREMAQLQVKRTLTEEDEREIEAKARAMELQSRELEQAMGQLQDRMQELQLEIMPNEAALRELEEKMRVKTAEIEKRMEERMERRRQERSEP